MTTYGILSIIPPILAIFLAIKTKQVIFSLGIGIYLGWVIITGNLFTGFLATLEAIIDVFKSAGNTRTVVFTLLIGALIQLIRSSGGVNGFINYLQNILNSSKKPERKIQSVAALTGFLLFVESNISILTVGTAFKPLFEKYGLAKEKLAYIADSSSAPSCILFPVNAWGAYIMGLLLTYEYLDPFKSLVYSIPFNFYPILTVIMVFYLTFSGKSFGAMKHFEQQARIKVTIEEPSTSKNENSPLLMIIPLLVMVFSMPPLLIYTGWDTNFTGNFFQKIWNSIGNGSGSSAVMYAVTIALVFTGIYYGFKRKLNFVSFFSEATKGMNDMLEMAILMVLAFAIGNLCNQLGTGNYVADVTASWLSPGLAPFILFITSCFVAFATGTSWGTFAIMISIAMPLANTMGINPYLALGAVLGGGVFGDHCSPISDTTLISSVASGSNHIDHVRTQLPYALIAGAGASILYLIAGVLMV